MPTAEYMREYRKRPGVREREYDYFHRAENRARWQRRNAERKAAKADWYQHSAKRIAKDRKTKRDYVAKFGRVPKRYIFTVADMAGALRTGHDPRWLADTRAAWKAGAKRGAKQGAATRKRRRKEDAEWLAYRKMFPSSSPYGLIDRALVRKSLKTGHDHLTEERERFRKKHETVWKPPAVDPRKAPPPEPFTAKDEAGYTRWIKKRRLFEGACDLRWQEYFEFRQANKCDRLTVNDRRYVALYASCAVPKR